MSRPGLEESMGPRTGLEGSMVLGQDKRDLSIVQDWRDLSLVRDWRNLWVWYRIGGIYGSITGLRWIYGSSHIISHSQYRIGGIYGSGTGLRWIYGSGTGLRWIYGSGKGQDGPMGLVKDWRDL